MRWLTNLLMIKDEERSSMLYYVALFVLLGIGLSLGRGSMAALFLKRYGVEYLPVMYALLSVFMAVASLTYAAYVDRVPSERLLVRMLGMLVMLVAGIWGMMSFTGSEWAYPAYYLVYELASELLVIHAKLYVEQNFDSLQLQRLSPPMFAGANIGKAVGGLLLGMIAPLIGVTNTLLIWAALAAIPVLLIVRRHERVGISPYFCPGRKGRSSIRQSVEQVSQGFKFLRKSELLRTASYALFFMIISFFILDYAVGRVLTETFPREDQLASFIGWLSAIMGTMALLVQLLVTGRLLRHFGVKRVGLIAPASTAASFLALLSSFTLPAALVGIFSRDVVFPAIRKPARMVFLHALPDYMAGRINALSVGLVLPLALLAASGFLLWTQSLPEPSYFVIGGVCASLMYLYFRVRANRAYTPALLSTLSHRLFLPQRHGEDLLHAGNEELCRELVRGVASSDENMALAHARMLIATCPEQAPPAIAQRLPTASHATRDRLLRLLLAQGLPVSDLLHDALADADLRLKATILEALFDAKDERARGHVEPCLHSGNPRLAAIGVLGVRRYALTDLDPSAQQVWERLLSSPHDTENIAGLELLARMPEARLQPRQRELMQHPAARVRRAALVALARFPQGALVECLPALQELYISGDPEIRGLCVSCYRMFDPETRRELCMQALEDRHHAVRDAAHRLLEETEGRNQAADIVSQWLLENRGGPRAQQSALNALARCQLPGEIFRRIAESKVREAGALSRALRVIRREFGDNLQRDTMLALVEKILQERVTQTLDVVLMAMENFEDRATVAAIRAGLASRDRRHIAHACEALHNLHDHALTAPLIMLVDDAGHEKKMARDVQGDGFRDARDVIAWCLRHPDSWLRECAARASLAPLSAGA